MVSTCPEDEQIDNYNKAISQPLTNPSVSLVAAEEALPVLLHAWVVCLQVGSLSWLEVSATFALSS